MSRGVSPADVVQALLDDPVFRFEDAGKYLRKGQCPGCGKRTLYVLKDKPWVIRCERLNKCGHEVTAREALPDVFADFARRYPPTEENRQATADAYLALDRGFDLSRIQGWYEQAAWPVPGTTDHIPTVRFYLDEGRTRWWERLIDRTKKDGQKANFGGRKKDDGSLFSGDAWTPPGMALEDGDRCFIVEGIFHAIALHHAGYKAIAAFSCSHFPSTFIEANAKRRIRWVVALDSDKAGREWARKHHARLKQMGELASVCLLPDGKDWDDLWRAGRIDTRFITDRLYYGRLFMAETVQEKAYVYYRRHRRGLFLLDFENAIYSITLGKDFDKALGEAAVQWSEQELEAKRTGAVPATPPTGKPNDEAQNPMDALLASPIGREIFAMHCSIDQVSNVLPRFLYMERDEIMDEQRYVFSVAYANGQPDDIISLEGTSITSPEAFHKAMLNRTRGGTFDGDAKQLKILRDRWLNSRMLTVTALPFVGYDNESGAWIGQQHAWHRGRRIPLNEHGYFNIGRRGIKSSLKGVTISTDGKFSPAWLKNYATAFHWQGMATLAFWLGSLFVQQIRAVHKTFPFLELTGEPGAGKSTILEFLWKCVGRDDYEGFDLLKSTPAGRRRAFSQVSNLPVVIIESDRDNGEKDTKLKQFGFDEVKTFYNGRSTGTLGVAKRSNDVDESPFQASLLISQNAEVDGSEALLQRIVHCHADKKHHKPGTRDVARWFERQTSSDVGGFLGAALARERDILETYQTAFERIEARYSDSSLKNERIIKNHAQVAACGHALGVIFPTMTDHLKDGLTEYLLLRAKAREQRLAADHPLVEQFWDTYDYLSIQLTKTTSRLDPLNHDRRDGVIAVNFNHFLEACRNCGQPTPDIGALKKLLPAGNARRFIAANRSVHSQHEKKTVKCWLFHAPKLPTMEED
ncbi:toprim domain-containing protein [Nitratidesulfovibrio vulgaris]|uniref:Putative phage protein n=1 Tax=Nitratidesulfovibrio vulgaris (strain DP4) TaxID=391774 RepID=A0A0H3A7M8_NITV4|nr:toprim domain-containing protein [Nitratidesulfovibrio vulgaris]ABM28502.1 putative phage protein [Nitratidesulfovibrio vulgaris DP4]